MGLAVVTVASGGMPVVETTSGLPVSEAANGRGVPVTKVIGKAGLPVTFETIGVAPAVPVLTTFATFNGTPSAGIVMSNGNLTVTHGTSNNATGNASSLTLLTGKYYFEIRLDVGFANGAGLGVRPYAGGVFTDVGGGYTGGIGVQPGTVNSYIWNNGTNTNTSLGIAAIADVFGLALDLTARRAWLRRNNGTWNADAGASPATGVNGLVLVAGAISPSVKFTNSGPTHAFTGNFGQSAFAFTAPAGFSLGWGT